MTKFKRGISSAAIAALVSFGASVGGLTGANAMTYNPATTYLSTLTISGVSPSGATIVGSVYDTDFGNFGAGTVETFLHGFFGATFVQIGGGDCTASCSLIGSGSNNGATYSGAAADIFAIHWGGGGTDQPLLALLFSSPITSFTISGFAHDVSFIRSYVDPPSPTPLPGTLVLMGTVIGGSVGIKKWRKRRNAGSAVAAA